jgi:hypothetical protein
VARIAVMSMIPQPERLIRFCGADCARCDSYQLFLAGDDSGLVNPETGYRCCWLPREYSKGSDCPIRLCCEQKGLRFCGECAQFEMCGEMAAFYAQPGYDELRNRMLEAVGRCR